MEKSIETADHRLGHTKFGKLDTLGLENLIVSAGHEALASAGIEASDIDAMWLGHSTRGSSMMLLFLDGARH